MSDGRERAIREATAIAALHTIESGFTVSKTYREAARDAIRAFSELSDDRDEWKQQHENLLAMYHARLQRDAAQGDAVSAIPREPTDAMLDAGHAAVDPALGDYRNLICLTDIWPAMYDAAISRDTKET